MIYSQNIYTPVDIRKLIRSRKERTTYLVGRGRILDGPLPLEYGGGGGGVAGGGLVLGPWLTRALYRKGNGNQRVVYVLQNGLYGKKTWSKKCRRGKEKLL